MLYFSFTHFCKIWGISRFTRYFAPPRGFLPLPCPAEKKAAPHIPGIKAHMIYSDHSDRSDPSDCKTHAMMTPIPWYLVFAGAWGASPPPAASSPPPPQLPSLALFFLAPMQNLSSTLAMRRGGLEIFFPIDRKKFLGSVVHSWEYNGRVKIRSAASADWLGQASRDVSIITDADDRRQWIFEQEMPSTQYSRQFSFVSCCIFIFWIEFTF